VNRDVCICSNGKLEGWKKKKRLYIFKKHINNLPASGWLPNKSTKYQLITGYLSSIGFSF
jgi:hypothetical protein